MISYLYLLADAGLFGASSLVLARRRLLTRPLDVSIICHASQYEFMRYITEKKVLKRPHFNS